METEAECTKDGIRVLGLFRQGNLPLEDSCPQIAPRHCHLPSDHFPWIMASLQGVAPG
jgi:hypothetical protein